MSFYDDLKKVVTAVFPPIILPQKRYVVLGFTIFYFVAKQLVALTPTKEDDILLEQIHNTALQIVLGAQNQDESA